MAWGDLCLAPKMNWKCLSRARLTKKRTRIARIARIGDVSYPRHTRNLHTESLALSENKNTPSAGAIQ